MKDKDAKTKKVEQAKSDSLNQVRQKKRKNMAKLEYKKKSNKIILDGIKIN